MELAEETEVAGGNRPQHDSVHHKSYMNQPAIEPGPPRLKAKD